MIPVPPRRSTPLSPEQIFSAGFRDGMNGYAHHPQFQNNIEYLRGYTAGSRSTSEHSVNPSRCDCNQELVNTAQPKTASSPAQPIEQDSPPWIPFFRRSTLHSALESMQSWEKDQQHFGFGRAALSFDRGWWVVLVSKDLHDAALPF